MRIRATRAVLGCFLLLIAPSGAYAQEEGVTVDPDSPSGKEYSLPVDSARDRASGKSGSTSSSPSDPDTDARFGEGLGASGTASADDDATAQGDSGGEPRDPSKDDAAAGESTPPADAASDPPATEADEDDGNSNLALIGVGALVIGAAGGGWMRWRGGKAT